MSSPNPTRGSWTELASLIPQNIPWTFTRSRTILTDDLTMAVRDYMYVQNYVWPFSTDASSNTVNREIFDLKTTRVTMFIRKSFV